MITICKNCGAAVDETMQTCPDCGNPNPWAQPAFDPWPSSEADPQQYLERGLFITGGISLVVSFWSVFSLAFDPWSELPTFVKASLIVFPVLTAACFFLSHRRDLWENRGVWRVVVQVLVGAGVVAAVLALMWR